MCRLAKIEEVKKFFLNKEAQITLSGWDEGIRGVKKNILANKRASRCITLHYMQRSETPKKFMHFRNALFAMLPNFFLNHTFLTRRVLNY
jgi:hypothetical protein